MASEVTSSMDIMTQQRQFSFASCRSLCRYLAIISIELFTSEAVIPYKGSPKFLPGKLNLECLLF